MLSLDDMRPMLTVKDVAQLLNIHVNTVRRWSDQNIIKSYRVTTRGDRRFKQEDIAHYLAELNEGRSLEPTLAGYDQASRVFPDRM
jgi:excisionase family DNA binding protein